MNITRHLNDLSGKFAKPKPRESSKWSKKVSERHTGDVAEVA